MFSPAFRMALERTLTDDITPEALEGVFRVSMRKMTDAKKCRTGINLSKNLLIAKIIHKTRNIIIAAKRDQESISVVAPTAVKTAVPTCPAKVTIPDKGPLVETQSEPTPITPSFVPSNTRLRSQHDSDTVTVDENVAPVSADINSRLCCSSPRPMKRPHSQCSDKSSEHSSTWSDSPSPNKITRMDVDDSQDVNPSHHSPSTITNSNSFSAVASPTSGHVHFQTLSPPTMNAVPPRWSFCAKDQPSASPVSTVIYSPYHQRMSMPLTTCPI